MPEVIYSLDESSKVATFTIDTAGPVNTIGERFLVDLEKATARANNDGVRGVVVVSAKKGSFLDGANLKEIIADSSPQSIRITVRRFQDAMAAVAKSPFPVVALLKDQTALGGGLEFLLWACDQVFATGGSRLGLPEVNVGLFPAAGGTNTLPRAIGFKAAVDAIANGRVMAADSYANSRFLTLCAPAELQSKAMAWIDGNQGLVNRNYDPVFSPPDPLTDEEAAAVISAARARYTICPHRSYLLATIDSLEAGRKLSVEEAVPEDTERFVGLFEHPNVRCKIDLFFLITSVAPRLAKADPRKAAPVNAVAVIGSGLMGTGIAQVAADKGLKTTLVDVDHATAERGLKRIENALADLVARGRWSSARKDKVMANLDYTTDYGRLKEIPLFIESVFEDLSIKQKVLAAVQEVNPDAIFASNTSTIPMEDISRGARRPEQVVGMHYFSPVPLMPLLEVVEGPGSSRQAVATAVTAGKAMGKTVIAVGDGPGFYTSRTFGRYVLSGFTLAEFGIPPWDVDMLAMKAGFPQGPLHVYGTAGGNVVYHAGGFMADRLSDRFEFPQSLVNMYNAGYVGAGQPSFYLDERKMTRNEAALNFMVSSNGIPRPSEEEAADILLLGMVNEAFWCLTDGVLRDYYSMDIGAVLGIGFPDCWHGPARFVSLKGVQAVRDRLQELSEKFQMPGLAPAPEFEQLIVCGLDSHLM